MTQRRTYDLTDPPGTPSPSPGAAARAAALEAASAPSPAVSVGTTTAPGASNAQLNYLTALLQSRDLPEEARDALSKWVGVQILLNEEHGDRTPPLAAAGLTKQRASDFIARLKDRPHRHDQPTTRSTDIPPVAALPSGHYAIKNAEGQIRFYRVWRGTRNPNYIQLYVEHGPDETEIRYGSPEFKVILGSIVYGDGGALAAARLYGREIGCCSECRRRLTNRVSRLLDIGPICGGHRCDPEIWKDMVRRAREALAAAGLDPDADGEDTDDLDRIRELARL
jgi:hypothetical protein